MITQLIWRKQKTLTRFQIPKSDLLFLLINAVLKHITSRPKLALTELAWLHLQRTFKHIQVLVGLAISSQALCEPNGPAGYGKQHSYFHTVMHLETEHPADTPLLGLGQQGCPFLQNILSQLTYHQGSQKLL